MKTVEITSGANNKLVLTEEEARKGVVLKFAEPFFGAKLTIEAADAPVAEKPKSTRIKGHPNCHIGECHDCHVVSCGIYQGYDTAEPEDD